MRFLKRLALFLVVNIAIVLILTTVVSLFGIQPYLTPYGLDLKSLAIYSIIIGFAGSFISLFLSKAMVKWTMHVTVIQQPRSVSEKQLFQTVTQIAKSLKIKMPEIGVYASPEVNAFATGWSRNHSLVAVSSGLLDNMSPEEVDGVLAHEMAHVANGDMVTMTLIQGVLNTFVIFLARIAAFAVGKLLSRNDDLGAVSYYFLSIAFQIVFGILASLIIFAFSRHREFQADHGGAQFVGAKKMIAALKRLHELHNRVDTRQKSLATMKISDKPSRIGRFFSTHPSLEERISRLEKGRLV